MADVECRVSTEQFLAYLRRDSEVSAPDHSRPGDILIIIEVDQGGRTGRWIAAEPVLAGVSSDASIVWSPPRVVAGWPPIAMNNSANDAAKRIP